MNPLFDGATSFERIERTRLAWYARNFLVARGEGPLPEGVPTQLQKDLELVKLRLLECHDPRELDVWLHSALRVAQAMNPYLSPDDLSAVWAQFMVTRCYGTLKDFQRRWIGLFRAVAARDAPRMGELGALLLRTQPELSSEAREYLLMATMAGYIANGEPQLALARWREQVDRLRNADSPAFRLLRCHASPGDCAAEFRAYAERSRD